MKAQTLAQHRREEVFCDKCPTSDGGFLSRPSCITNCATTSFCISAEQDFAIRNILA